ncbi:MULTISPECIES: hypothetical protein [unclassified Massilia]|uniref:hypothetical protein n=1 Tax=unclassified Massilia TaxID=2609279 RepID=UPI0017848A3D|nr:MULTISPECIES: hypothetical protein [unclassified Massilia]MBD8531589.1 hypothetical protein [Massilia sp. CFBP 13647]MBD8673615.1 hypothetical protein [Massilia sp. CFBP 13721]
MIDLIPTKYRLAAGLAALVLALASAAAAGAVANGWRLDAAHLRALAAEREKRVAVEARLLEQSAAVDKLGAEKVAADGRREVAEKFAAAVIARAQSRGAAVAASQAPDCGGVMREAWGRW